MRLTPLLILLPLLSLAAATRAGESAKDTEGPIRVTINAEKTGAPINPFIYGQFIEHLGRCIYGGIWAEMLEDRKFYFPIKADYLPYRGIENPDFPGEVLIGAYPIVGASPWQIIGEAGAVTMVKEGAFVGNHAPRINAGAG